MLRDVQPPFCELRGFRISVWGSKTPPKLELVLHFQLSFDDLLWYACLACMHWVQDGKTESKGGRCRGHCAPLPQQQQQRVAVFEAFGRPVYELQLVAPAAACLAAAAVQAYQPEMPTLPATHSAQTVVIIMFESFACAGRDLL